ncbi:DUF2207 domain-containing protein, partial [Actinoalloteichus spitiensis]|uniref:DUF2207 domain-containing protein n=1 Tax=Actinoalloteichus spitiensis TaxID=252394 RepID=UPI00036747DA
MLRRFSSLLAVLGFLLLVAPQAAVASSTAGDVRERIVDLAIEAEVTEDGAVRVVETIEYSFGMYSRRGIFRHIPVSYPVERADGSVDDLKERYIEVVGVSATMDGAPVETAINPEGADNDGSADVIRLGDPNSQVTGTHTYEISYEMRGLLNAPEGQPELFWNAFGDQWEVPVDSVSVAVTAPGPISRVRCAAGDPAQPDVDCPVAAADGDTARFEAGPLGPRNAVTVVVALPDTVTVPPAMERTRQTPAALVMSNLTRPGEGAGIGSGWVFGGAAVVLGGAGALLARTLRRGRDSYFVGQTPGLAPAEGQQAREAVRGLGQRDEVAVRFTPPDDIPPALCGAILKENADTAEVTATVTDLAVRGYLRVEEKGSDHVLVRLRRADAELTDFEGLILNGLFSGARDGRRTMKSLSGKFHQTQSSARQRILDQTTRRGWYKHRPDRVRDGYRMGGLAVAAGAALATWFLLVPVDLGLLGLPVVLAGLAMAVLAGRMPARTALGSTALAQTRDFRRYLEVAEADQISEEERQTIFNRYLPYAQVFGLAEVWTKKFAAVGAAEPDGWYRGRPGRAGFYPAYQGFHRSMRTTLPAVPRSKGNTGGFGGGRSGFRGGSIGGR